MPRAFVSYFLDGHLSLKSTVFTACGETVVTQLLREIDPLLMFLVGWPLAIAGAAWALRMASSFCGVDPPEFWMASITILLIVTANVGIRYWVQVAHIQPTLWSQVMLPLAAAASIIAISLRTGFVSALMITMVEGLIVCMLYIGLMTAGSAMLSLV